MTMSTPTKRKVLVVAVVAVFTALVWWRTETVVPQWTVAVRTSEGAPIAGVPVLEAWQHQTMEGASHTDVRVTGPDGVVEFPRRTIRASTIRSILGAGRALLRSSHEASFGPYAQVIVGVEGMKKGCDYLSYMPNVQGGPREEPLASSCIVTGSFTIKQL